MNKLIREDLMSLETYDRKRPEFRKQIMAHKKTRIVQVGPHVTLHFENRLLIQYQIQEMLRIEKIFEAEGIQEELDTYNPLIPDGSNWKATQMIEFTDPNVRATELTRLIGIENKTWVRVGNHEKVFAIADEDLERDNGTKTSSVHFMRFELLPEMVAGATAGMPVHAGISHENYQHEVMLGNAFRESLVEDLAP